MISPLCQSFLVLLYLGSIFFLHITFLVKRKSFKSSETEDVNNVSHWSDWAKRSKITPQYIREWWSAQYSLKANLLPTCGVIGRKKSTLKSYWEKYFLSWNQHRDLKSLSESVPLFPNKEVLFIKVGWQSCLQRWLGQRAALLSDFTLKTLTVF